MDKIDNMLLELPLHLKKDELNYVLYVVHLVHEYEERIDKAIEYIEEDIYSEPHELYGLVDGEHLLKILKGEDK